MDALSANRNAAVLEVSPKSHATQVKPCRTLCLIWNMLERYSLYKMYGNLSLSMSSPMWRRWLCSTDPKSLSAHEYGRLGLSIRRSIVFHKRASFWFFACCDLGARTWWSSNLGQWSTQTSQRDCKWGKSTD